MAGNEKWWAKGLLFENCNCTSVCPGHISFRQPCTHERCLGYWAMQITGGRQGEVSLAGLNVFIANDTPQVMFEGGWIQEVFIDERADAEQRKILEDIFLGKIGSGWAVLSQFVADRLTTRYVPIHISAENGKMAISIDGVLESTVKGKKGVDKTSNVVLLNLPNQIHGPEHNLGFGDTKFQGEKVKFQMEYSNAIFSNFSWEGP